MLLSAKNALATFDPLCEMKTARANELLKYLDIPANFESNDVSECNALIMKSILDANKKESIQNMTNSTVT